VPEGARVSLFPLLETRGTHSVGLLWPVQDLTLAPGRQIGTSNRASGGRITVGFDRPGALLLLERDRLGPLLSALTEPE
jgi:thiamine pyrophosphokinase